MNNSSRYAHLAMVAAILLASSRTNARVASTIERRSAIAATKSDVSTITRKSIAEKDSKQANWMRLDTGLSHISPNINAQYIAFIPEKKLGIRILNLKSGNIIEPSAHYIGPSFFWSPDGMRLFYRELLPKAGKTVSRVRAWDVVQNKNIDVETFDGASGLLSFDPRDNRMLLMYKNGIKSKKLVFPNNRLAFWQAAERNDLGKWVVAQKGVTFVSDAGFAMQKLTDDGSGIESFDISPDGSSAAWATRSGKIFFSQQGESPKFLDYGRDPKWHPEKPLLVFAGGRMVGNKAADYDIKITSPNSKASFLTATQHLAERWPAWSPDGKTIFFTLQGSNELRTMNFPQPSDSISKMDGSTADQAKTMGIRPAVKAPMEKKL